MSDPTPSPRRRRIQRARRFPHVPTWLWMLLGTVLLAWGLSALRPTPEPAATEPQLAAATIASVAAPPPTSEARPELTPLATEPSNMPQSHIVQPGESLSSIAELFGVPVDQLMALNGITDPNTLYAGQTLMLPARFEMAAPPQQLLPDSEVVLGPAYRDFDLRTVAQAFGGYLVAHQEEVEGEVLDGVAIVERVSQRYSLGPRVLLALLEHSGGWVTNPEPGERTYPLGLREGVRGGLYHQLSAAARALNQGYYDLTDARGRMLQFADGTQAEVAQTTNAGTAALQRFFAVQGTPESWSAALGQEGFPATYERLFGDPWARDVPDLIPPDLAQPELRLPWTDEERWFFTGGPHGGWADSSSWAALDFVPPDITGCFYSTYFARAVAPGLVIRSENGEVVIDLDGDGFVGTGWTLLYMHMAEAVPVGTTVAAGDPVGRPSCEGGVSDAAHLHLARRYNGQWIEAAGDVPFNLAGWEAVSAPRAYDGYLVRDGVQKEACACRDDTLNGLAAP